MSRDARNSICLWLGSIALFGFLWASISFDLLPAVPDEWAGPVMLALVLLNLAEMAHFFWRRRRSSTGDTGSG